jgi:hypothetical protein
MKTYEKTCNEVREIDDNELKYKFIIICECLEDKIICSCAVHKLR